MDEQGILRLIESGGVPYAEARGKIVSGDLLFLHHDFVASWYGLQIEAVQRFTGPLAHIAVFDWVRMGTDPDGELRLDVLESVVPYGRCVPVSSTAEEGFIWVHLNKPMTAEERRHIWAEICKPPYEYSKPGAIDAGLAYKRGVPQPASEDQDPRRWCAKFARLARAQSGVDLGPYDVPTAQFLWVVNKLGGIPQYVRMA